LLLVVVADVELEVQVQALVVAEVLAVYSALQQL
jgi:hypothetical protein